jgi:type IV pilus assembly protein PilW
MNKSIKKRSSGVTLIELLIALTVSAILIAGIYRIFIYHQRTYATQEQVADMQQNVRVAINRMMREIRMAGFGGKNENTDGNNDIINIFGNVNGFANIINPENDVTEDGITHDRITVVAAYSRIATIAADVTAGSNLFSVNYNGSTKFNSEARRYVCINGRNNYEIVPAAGNHLTLAGASTLNENHSTGEPVFLVRAIRYGLRVDNQGIPVLFRDLYPNTGSSKRESVAEYIEDLKICYILGNEPNSCAPIVGNPTQIRGIKIAITARTKSSDFQLKEGSGFRRRTINTYIDLRNLKDDSP